MATKKSATKKGDDGHALEIGAGVAAAALAAGVGYYYFGSKDAKKHRKEAAKWTEDLKKDVVKNAKKLKRVNAETIAKIVDEAAAAYEGVRGVDQKDVRAAAGELKENWEHIKKQLSGTTTKKVAKKVAKKPVKKVAKKTATKAKKVAKK